MKLQEETVQTPLKIDFQGFTPNDRQKAAIQEHIEAFEKRFGAISSGRITVVGPGGRHQSGGLYGINLWFRLPDGKEVDASRTPDADERHSDFFFALNDSFKRARSQLQDKVGRLRGGVKHHEPQATGTVTKLFEDHGFLENSAGQEIYFHRNSVLNGHFGKLKLGLQVSFVEETGEDGPQASTVRL
jgi:cold shock CspA family protein